MIEVVPAIIPESLDQIFERVNLVKQFVDRVQIDIVDGKFAPSLSWPHLEKELATDFVEIIREEKGLPYWQEIDYEIDLMVSAPKVSADHWISAGAKALIFHIESSKEIYQIINELRERFPTEGGNSLVGLEIGLALNPSTDNSALDDFIAKIDFVQFMGNDKIGYQGVSLDERVYQKVSELRKKYPKLKIAVDIGVDEITAPKLVLSGATKLVSGSAIFKSENIGERIEYMKGL